MNNIYENYFQVTIKGLFFDNENKLLMIQDKYGLWELPGGRMKKGEEFIECLKRECREELGLDCEVLDTQPYFVCPAIDKEGVGRIVVSYRIKFSSLDFKKCDECVNIRFFGKDEIKNLPTYPQIKKLLDLVL